nr:DUF6543 domain-containing protein [Pseudomonas fuscovaginae]
MLQSLVDSTQVTRWDQQPVKGYTLTLLDFPNVDGGAWGALLKGVLLIEHSLPAANGERPCVAYFAGDPQQAVKRYSSFNALHQDLRERLRDKTYQAFARRYVHLRTQPAFFQALEDRLNPLDPVSGHRKPAPNASLNAGEKPAGRQPLQRILRTANGEKTR